MTIIKKANKINYTQCIFVAYLLLYSVFSLSFLTEFPFVHSDESWLAGLSRNMLEKGSLSVTEAFFDARVRYPHAIKILFHLLQMGFIKVFGYSIDSVRLISLVGAVLFLVLFYFLIKKVTGKEKLALAMVVLFSADAEFIYVSHFARQEIWLGIGIVLGLFLLLDGGANEKKTAICAAIVTGIAVGFHPNSFLLACSFGSILLFESLYRYKTEGHKKTICAPLLMYIGVTGLCAGIFVGISYFYDSKFITHYFQNGSLEFDVDASIITKLGALPAFFQKLTDKFSGTYYITELRFSLLLFAFLAIFMGIYALVMREKQVGKIIVGGLGLLVGMVIIGRYNQTSVFFLFPYGYLLFAKLLSFMEPKGRIGSYVTVFAITVVIAIGQIRPWLEKDGYENYLSQLETYIPSDAMAVANLNTDFYFDNGCLRDYRNLPYAIEQGTLKEYMEKNQIEYVVYSTELDFIYENRPFFNVIYGNAEFVPELQQFCQQYGEIVGEFTNTEYASRVIGIMGQEEYSKVIVYKMKK